MATTPTTVKPAKKAAVAPQPRPRPTLTLPTVTDPGDMSTIRHTLGQLVSSPKAGDMLEAAMASVMDAFLRDSSEPDWTLLVGPPSSGKTEVIRAVKGRRTRSMDVAASSKSFLSGMKEKSGGRAASAVDEFANKCVLIKDLTAMLSEHPDSAKAILGVLTNLYDGEFSKAVGTMAQGESAFLESAARFSLVAAVTPETWAQHSRMVEKMGARLLVYVAPALTPTEVAEGYALTKQSAHRPGLRDLLRAHVGARIERAAAVGEVAIPADVDKWLQTGAEFIAAGRTPIRSESIPHEDGRRRYEESVGETEAPFRVYQQLGNKLRNLCRINGRNTPTSHEQRILLHLILSSITLDRAQVMLAVWGRPTFEIKHVIAAARLTYESARYRLQTMKDVGLLVHEAEAGKAASWRLAPRFSCLLSGVGQDCQTDIERII